MLFLRLKGRQHIMGKKLKGKELGQGIRQRKDGKYEARYKIGGVSKSIYSDDLNDLRYKLEIEKARAHSDLNTVYADATLDEWFDDWFDNYKEKTVKATSATTIKTRYHNNFHGAIGDRKVKELKPLDIQRVLNDMHAKGRKKNYIRNVFSEIKDCLEYAVHNGIINRNPCIDAMVPRDDSEPVEQRFLTIEEQNIFLDCVKNNFAWYYPMFYVMFSTGMRVGAVGGLTWDDVDFKHNCFHIRHSLVYDYKGQNGKKLYLSTPKTKSSYRIIPFIDGVRELMITQREQLKFQKVKLGKRWRGKIENVCFCTGMGSEVGRAACNYTIGAIVNKINKDNMNKPDYVEFENFNPHAIRHTFCSRCYQAGLDVKITQAIMGHSSSTITLDCYTHFAKDSLFDAMKKFGKMS